jgi:hypothetical protein
VDETFPMKLWNRLLPQTVLTLNLLWQSNVASTVLATNTFTARLITTKCHWHQWGVQFKSTQTVRKRGSWVANVVDGWYLQTFPEDYWCHIVYVKNTRSERVSDAIHFKHKYITQPTLTPEDIIVKAINDLTQALKERRNKKGTELIEALKKIDELLNKVPATITTPQPSKAITENRQVTFAATSKPPHETQPTQRDTNKKPTPRVVTPHPSITNAIVDKPIPPKIPPPNMNENSPESIKLKQHIINVTNSRARIPQRHQMNLHRQDYTEHTQLIYNQEST